MSSITAEQYNLLRSGFEKARKDVESPDLETSTIRTAQALFWAISLDDRLERLNDYKSRRNTDSSGRLLLGLRIPRNAVAHGTPITVHHSGGMTFPLVFPATAFEVHWVELQPLVESLRDEPNAVRQEIYANELAGKRIIITFNVIARWFDQYKASWQP